MEKKVNKESNTDRLRFIIEEPALRSRFREFLRDNFCEENLSFWLEVEDFKKKFSITSSAMASGSSRGNSKTSGQAAMERHHEALIHIAFEIYNTYLAPSSQCELNIDHGLRNELSAYLNEVMTGLTGKAFQGRVELEQASAFNATQLQSLIELYKRIQTHVFRLMATDSVPKVRVTLQETLRPSLIITQFIKTPKFLALRNWVEEFDLDDGEFPSATPSVPPGLADSEEVGGAYVTVSQQASERSHQQPPNAGHEYEQK